MAGVCFGCCGGYFQYLCPDSSPAALQHIRDKLPKTRQKLHSKNSWNWVVILVSATIWQVLNVKGLKTGHGNDVNQLKIALKNSWNHIKWIYFWLILPIWNHSVAAAWRLLLNWGRGCFEAVLQLRRPSTAVLTALHWGYSQLLSLEVLFSTVSSEMKTSQLCTQNYCWG